MENSQSMVCGSAQYGECQSKIKKYISIVISEINEMKKNKRDKFKWEKQQWKLLDDSKCTQVQYFSKTTREKVTKLCFEEYV